MFEKRCCYGNSAGGCDFAAMMAKQRFAQQLRRLYRGYLNQRALGIVVLPETSSAGSEDEASQAFRLFSFARSRCRIRL